MKKLSINILSAITAAALIFSSNAQPANATTVENPGKNRQKVATTQQPEMSAEEIEKLNNQNQEVDPTTVEAEEGAETNPGDATAIPEATGIDAIATPQGERKNSGQVYLNDPLDNPVPVIYSYEVVGDGAITPGEEFTLKFTVYNPAVVSNVGNIRIEVIQEKGLVYPVYGKTNSIYNEDWPAINEKELQGGNIIIPVQVNGKLKAQVEVSSTLSKEEILEAVKKDEKVAKLIENNEIIKEVYVPGKILNLVVKK